MISFQSRLRSLFTIAVVCSLSLIQLAYAQDVEWAELTPSTTPPGRVDAGMAYDSGNKRIVLFGGDNGFGTSLSDTWSFDGTNWSQLSPAASPTDRDGHAMAYDAQNEAILIFGGRVGIFPSAQTWSFNGSTWSQLNPSSSPSARRDARMVYETANNRLILFGGQTIDDFSAETWTWTGTNWSQLSPANSPSKRSLAAMAYDSTRNVIVLFGGFNGGFLSDTWEFDGTNWTQKTGLTNAPSVRASAAMTYDANLQKIVLFGGSTPAGPLGGTWTWDGTSWEELSLEDEPSNVSNHQLAYDAENKKSVLFSGAVLTGLYTETWTFGAIVDDGFPSAKEFPAKVCVKHSNGEKEENEKVLGTYDLVSTDFKETLSEDGQSLVSNLRSAVYEGTYQFGKQVLNPRISLELGVEPWKDKPGEFAYSYSGKISVKYLQDVLGGGGKKATVERIWTASRDYSTDRGDPSDKNRQWEISEAPFITFVTVACTNSSTQGVVIEEGACTGSGNAGNTPTGKISGTTTRNRSRASGSEVSINASTLGALLFAGSTPGEVSPPQFIKGVLVNEDGTYEFANLDAGDYHIIFRDINNNSSSDVVSVSLADGESVTAATVAVEIEETNDEGCERTATFSSIENAFQKLTTLRSSLSSALSARESSLNRKTGITAKKLSKGLADLEVMEEKINSAISDIYNLASDFPLVVLSKCPAANNCSQESFNSTRNSFEKNIKKLSKVVKGYSRKNKRDFKGKSDKKSFKKLGRSLNKEISRLKKTLNDFPKSQELCPAL